jgi:hypothetical protein
VIGELLAKTDIVPLVCPEATFTVTGTAALTRVPLTGALISIAELIIAPLSA